MEKKSETKIMKITHSVSGIHYMTNSAQNFLKGAIYGNTGLLKIQNFSKGGAIKMDP